MLLDRASALQDLPATAAALAAGQIDMPKALVFITGLNGQDPALARGIEASLIGRAPAQTTGQLRAALHRALLAADPAAAERRRQAEERQARIERAPEPGGVTASLAGRYLPVPAAVAAWNNVTATARQLRRSGTPGTLDELRVHAYLALLSGQAASALTTEDTATSEATGTTGTDSGAPSPAGTNTAGQAHPAPTGHTDHGHADHGHADHGPTSQADPRPTGHTGRADPGPTGTGNPDPAVAPDPDPHITPGPRTTTGRPQPPAPSPAGSTPAGSTPAGSTGGLTGSVHLTIPLTALLGLTDTPGELGGFGPITAVTARDLAARTVGAPAVRWCVTVTDDTGQATGHGCAAPTRPSRNSPGWAVTMNICALADTDCTHTRQSSHYRPPPLLWHLMKIRNQRCTAPGCRMPAARCDNDHTQPYNQGGRTCECNLGPLCRYHHRIKHSRGWRLEQPTPGIFIWQTPSGRTYTTGPENYAA